jgi:uncharacterized membrane protein
MEKSSVKQFFSFFSKTTAIEILVLVTLVFYLLDYFKPELILLKTTVTGGDTGSHNYLVYYMKNYLLPKGTVFGWSPDWYAGFPIFQFYFPLPYLIASFIAYFLPIEIALKIVTVSGIFLLPITAYTCFRLMDFEFPIPSFAAILTIPFLFLESHTIYGGNIPSTLAGEFSYSIGLALSVLLLGLFYRGIKTGQNSVLISLLLAIIALTHLLPTFLVVTTMLYFVYMHKTSGKLGYTIKILGLAFALSSFWSIPFLLKSNYTAHLEWSQLKGLGFLLPQYILGKKRGIFE